MANKFVKSVGNQTQKALSRLNYVNPVKWGVIPGIVGFVIVIAIVIYIRPSLNGSRTFPECHTELQCNGQHNCNKTRRICRQKTVSNKLNILWYTLLPIVGALFVGSIFYKLGFMINNPKTGVAIGAVSLLRGALR